MNELLSGVTISQMAWAAPPSAPVVITSRLARGFPQREKQKHVCCFLPVKLCGEFGYIRRAALVIASASGRSSSENDLNPFSVLGVNPIEGFDAVKVSYSRKRKDAERRGHQETVLQLEEAYDKIVMMQLSNRRKGITYGSFKVSKDIKYADKQPLISWGPRFSKSGTKDIRINMAISAVFLAWVLVARGAEWKPLQFLGFVFVYRMFEKLKAAEPPTSSTLIVEGGEDEGRMARMGKRLFRSLSLVFGCITFVSLAYTGALNTIEVVGGYIPTLLYSNQEVIVTVSCAILLHLLASYYT